MQLTPRIRRKLRTVQAMIRLFCQRQHHNPARLCKACQELDEYAVTRLYRCPFQSDSTTCARCATHCYNPAMRAKIIEVMRYAGPRMLLRHPILACAHLLDEKRAKKQASSTQGPDGVRGLFSWKKRRK